MRRGWKILIGVVAVLVGVNADKPANAKKPTVRHEMQKRLQNQEPVRKRP